MRTNRLGLYTASLVTLGSIPFTVAAAEAVSTEQTSALPQIKQQLVNPYVSIGGNFFYFDHAHHWAMGGELGVTFTGDPEVSLTRSGSPSAAADAALLVEKNRIEDYANQFKWWPVVKLMVTYAF